MELAGHECVGFCEFDKFATASYTSMHLLTLEQRERLNEMPLKQRRKEILKEEYRNGEWYANDIRRLYAEDIPRADCWCFGFPCQDISVAGKQLGFQGNRSSLFFRVMYLIRQLEEENRPTYLFIENVKNLLSVNGGWDFARLLIEMEQGGYDAECRVGIDSVNFSMPNSKTRRGRVGQEIANTLDTSCNQGIFVQVSEELVVYAVWYEKYQCYIAIRRLTPLECFRLQGWTDDYFKKAEFVNSDSQLYKQAGNGVTVNVIRAIAEKLGAKQEMRFERVGDE